MERKNYKIMTFHLQAQSDKSHRRKPLLGLELNNKEGGDAPIEVLKELKVPEPLVTV